MLYFICCKLIILWQLDMATIIDGKKRVPFMRGMLISYLVQRGFADEDAHALANAVRDSLSKHKDIQKKDMVKLVEQLIGEKHDGRQVGDLVFWERLPTSITVERKNGSRPFSKELLSHSIQASGLDPDQAYQIARTIESQLIDQRRGHIDHLELEDLAAAVLAERHDESFAERYKVWRAWGDLERPLVILIGGATGAGKTSLAVSLANVLDIPRVVATDDIRQIMRLMLSPELMPAIHSSSYTVWSSAPTTGVQDQDPVITGFREQAKIVSVGVRAILSRCIEENASVIIDGVHLLPDFIDVQEGGPAFLVPLCLALGDRKVYEERFAKRAAAAPSRPTHRYLSHLEEILKIQEHIVESSAQHDIPIIDTETVEDATSAAVMVVVEHLQEQEEMKKVLDKKQKKKKKRKS